MLNDSGIAKLTGYGIILLSITTNMNENTEQPFIDNQRESTPINEYHTGPKKPENITEFNLSDLMDNRVERATDESEEIARMLENIDPSILKGLEDAVSGADEVIVQRVPKTPEDDPHLPKALGDYRAGINPYNNLPLSMSDEEVEELKRKDFKIAAACMPEVVRDRLVVQAEEAIRKCWKFEKLNGEKTQIPQVNAVAFVNIVKELAYETYSGREWHAAVNLALGRLNEMEEAGKINFSDDGMNESIKNTGRNAIAEQLYKGKTNNIPHTCAWTDSNALKIREPGYKLAKEQKDSSEGMRRLLGVNEGDIRAWEFAEQMTYAAEESRFAAVAYMEENFLES